MSGGRGRKLVAGAMVGALVAAAVKVLRGEPTPAFSNHPTVDGGHRPDPSARADAPFEAPAETVVAAVLAPVADVSADEQTGPEVTEQTWAAPVDGACPDGFPVKAKLKSGIFHLPGMLAYDRTIPDRCYPSADTAAADGLRPAKR